MLLKIYDNLFLKRPLLALLFCLAIISFFGSQAPKFKLDASADSLILENDQALRYFRQMYSQYGANDYLVVTYSPRQDLFSDGSLADLDTLSRELNELDGVDSIVSILNVPLLFSPKIELSTLSDRIKTLQNNDTDRNLAKEEFLNNPIYRKQLLSEDGQTTAVLINLPIDLEIRRLLKRRTELRIKKAAENISVLELQELDLVSSQYRKRATNLTTRQNHTVENIREIIDRHRSKAKLYLGGVPMIIDDMISFIKNDIILFSIGVMAFLIITLALIFRRKRWITLPLICCFAASFSMVGFLGMMDWRVTVISSNFISLMLIITMSLTIHLIVRYRELCVKLPEASQRALLLETVRLTFKPCLYTTLTTIVAFASLLVSSIRPVMDFGMMMTIGLITSFVLTFMIFPTAAMLIKREKIEVANDKSSPFTLIFASFSQGHGRLIVIISLLLAVLSVAGINKLVVENRFIDYFRQSTEIYQGMKLIDQKLGGTSPLDVIIDFRDEEGPVVDQSTSLSITDMLDDELLEDDFGDSQDFSSPKYWFTAYRMERLGKVHDFLNNLEETGKVMSIANMIKIATSLNNNIPLDDYELSIMYEKLPANLKDLLIKPYVSVQNNQARLTMRIMETSKSLSRQELLNKIRSFLVNTMHFGPEQIHFTNMVVLYNNMLQSLFRSQIMTIGVVFLGIMIMFMVLFRSIAIAFIAIIPNLLPAAMVLGGMGWLGIPLDMMTITIAAITIGIAVDDTIHYVHRFKKEFEVDRDYTATMFRCHASIGKAMYYTSLTIIIGFSILTVSNFIPTVYFGLFTGFGMLTALLAALTLLPRLIIIFKPLGPENKTVDI